MQGNNEDFFSHNSFQESFKDPRTSLIEEIKRLKQENLKQMLVLDAIKNHLQVLGALDEKGEFNLKCPIILKKLSLKQMAWTFFGCGHSISEEGILGLISQGKFTVCDPAIETASFGSRDSNYNYGDIRRTGASVKFLLNRFKSLKDQRLRCPICRNESTDLGAYRNPALSHIGEIAKLVQKFTIPKKNIRNQTDFEIAYSHSDEFSKRPGLKRDSSIRSRSRSLSRNRAVKERSKLRAREELDRREAEEIRALRRTKGKLHKFKKIEETSRHKIALETRPQFENAQDGTTIAEKFIRKSETDENLVNCETSKQCLDSVITSYTYPVLKQLCQESVNKVGKEFIFLGTLPLHESDLQLCVETLEKYQDAIQFFNQEIDRSRKTIEETLARIQKISESYTKLEDHCNTLSNFIIGLSK